MHNKNECYQCKIEEIKQHGKFNYIADFKNDGMHGWKKTFRKDGTLKMEKEFKEGYATGNYKKYSKNGSRTKEVEVE